MRVVSRLQVQQHQGETKKIYYPSKTLLNKWLQHKMKHQLLDHVQGLTQLVIHWATYDLGYIIIHQDHHHQTGEVVYFNDCRNDYTQ